MRIRTTKTTHDRVRDDGFGIGLLLLAIGIAIGALADPARWFASSEGGEERREQPRALHSYLEPAGSTPAAVADNGLDTLRLTVSPEAAETLQRVRDRALERGLILQEEEDTVRAEVALADTHLQADVRIKGDWLDHVRTDKWSLRIQVKGGRLFGMRVFSIQAPSTRGHLWEWLVLAAARREGVLAPRATFVNVVINEHPAGVYYLEEHFSKELLESQGRREGPIVRWDESTHWATRLRAHQLNNLASTATPTPMNVGMESSVAPVRAYGEKRLTEIDSLSRALDSAVAKMHALKDLIRTGRIVHERDRYVTQLETVQGELIDEVMNVDVLARAHALASLLQIQHALVWHNMRFYHDPVLDRLEPIMFDNMAQNAASQLPVMFRASGLTREFRFSHAYYEGVFRYLGDYCDPGWLEALFDELGPDLARFEAALEAEEPLPAALTVAGMMQRLRREQTYLRRILYPRDAINVEAFCELDPSEGEQVSGDFVVLAWSTTQAPIVVEGFRFSNGGFVPAAPHVAAAFDARASPEPTSGARDRGVVLPYDSSPVTFRFPIDERLANLEGVRELKQAVRQRASGRRALDFDVDIVFRPVATDDERTEPLRFRQTDERWAEEGGRPRAPDYDEVMRRHAFLRFDADTGHLVSIPGTWDVDGDLAVPRGMVLRLAAGTTLRFPPDAVLVTDSAVHFEGKDGEPVVLEPVEGADHWSGIAVLDAPERSTWKHTVVRRTDAVRRSGWVVTGGITFYRSSVSMESCRIEGTLAEDGCNVFGADLDLRDVDFDGCASDSFDGDFVSGTIAGCTFRNGLADGIDLSGSDVEVVDCTFTSLGDKALSIGEDTEVRVRGGVAEDVSIGVASKDRSRATIAGLEIRNARNYALTAFVKKAEFGPSVLVATGVRITGSGLGDALAQTGCELTIDGEPVPTVELDVDALYRDGILGR